MSVKQSAVIDLGYPIYGAKFFDNKAILTVGGGGEGNNGIPNKVTVVKCSFKSKDKSRHLQRFREFELPAGEDCPMCVDVAKIPSDNDTGNDHDKDHDYSVFFGCNQSSRLIKSMSINNNLRKYRYTNDEHLRFVDAAQFEELGGSGAASDDGVQDEKSIEYPKIIALSPHNSVGCMMTSEVPSSVYIFRPDTLDLVHKFVPPSKEIEIKDFHLSPHDDGKTLGYITSTSIETASTVTNNHIASSNSIPQVATTLKNYILSKIRFIDDNNVIITAASRDRKKPGVSIFHYSLTHQKIVKQKQISSKIRGIVAIDINIPQDLIAVAGNDFSVTLVRLSDFKSLQTFTKLHKFAVTCLSFSPNGTKLATGSASNSLLVLKIPHNFAKGKSSIGTLVQYLVFTILAVLLSMFVQQAHQSGQLDEWVEVSKYYGEIGYDVVKHEAASLYDVAKEKILGENVDGDDDTKKYFKVDEWEPAVTESYVPTSSIASQDIETSTVTESTASDQSSTTISNTDSENSNSFDVSATTQDEVRVEQVTRDIGADTSGESGDIEFTDSTPVINNSLLEETTYSQPTPEVKPTASNEVSEPTSISEPQIATHSSSDASSDTESEESATALVPDDSLDKKLHDSSNVAYGTNESTSSEPQVQFTNAPISIQPTAEQAPTSHQSTDPAEIKEESSTVSVDDELPVSVDVSSSAADESTVTFDDRSSLTVEVSSLASADDKSSVSFDDSTSVRVDDQPHSSGVPHQDGAIQDDNEDSEEEVEEVIEEVEDGAEEVVEEAVEDDTEEVVEEVVEDDAEEEEIIEQVDEVIEEESDHDEQEQDLVSGDQGHLDEAETKEEQANHVSLTESVESPDATEQNAPIDQEIIKAEEPESNEQTSMGNEETIIEEPKQSHVEPSDVAPKQDAISSEPVAEQDHTTQDESSVSEVTSDLPVDAEQIATREPIDVPATVSDVPVEIINTQEASSSAASETAVVSETSTDATHEESISEAHPGAGEYTSSEPVGEPVEVSTDTVETPTTVSHSSTSSSQESIIESTSTIASSSTSSSQESIIESTSTIASSSTSSSQEVGSSVETESVSPTEVAPTTEVATTSQQVQVPKLSTRDIDELTKVTVTEVPNFSTENVPEPTPVSSSKKRKTRTRTRTIKRTKVKPVATPAATPAAAHPAHDEL